MKIREYIDLFGGQTAVARILGFKSARAVRVWVANDSMPEWAVIELRAHHITVATALLYNFKPEFDIKKSARKCVKYKI